MADRNVLITGGSGAFGNAFVRRCLADGARRIAVFSRSESKQAEMRAAISDPRVEYMIGCVRSLPRLMDALRDVDIVVHAAALKRVEVCEREREEAHETNVNGTCNVAKAAIACGVRRGIFLSTDKAANPGTYYGVTKLDAEGLWIGENVRAAGTHTRLSVTRYGNVAGSTGSVIPIWRAQRASGVLSVTDLAMTRFLMSMDEACDLVMRAISDSVGAEIFVPKIASASLYELATAFAPECKIRVIGARPGEKMHETLITEDEARRTYEAPTHFVIEPTERTWASLAPPDYPKVDADFAYRSDTARSFLNGDLQRLVAA